MQWVQDQNQSNVENLNTVIKAYTDIYVNTQQILFIVIYYWYSALGPVWAETRVQSGDWYSSGTLHPGQVLRGSLPLLSPAF